MAELSAGVQGLGEPYIEGLLGIEQLDRRKG